MATKNNNSSIKKAKLLVTIVDRNKIEYYTDVLSGFEINLQMVLYGQGTASTSTLELLGLNNNKGIILSVVRTDMIKTVLNTLEEKFQTIRNGKGIACVVPISSVIGLSIYQFMINNRKNRGE
jgi:hypothetical protein